MGERENVKAGPYLMALLDDENEIVRIGAARGLGVIKYDKAVNRLIEKVDNEKGIVAEIAILSIGQIGGEKATEFLIAVLSDKSRHDFLRSNAAEAIGMIKDKKAVESLIEVVKENSYNSIAAAEALGEIGNGGTIESCGFGIGNVKAVEAIRTAIKQETDPFALKKYKEAYKKLTGEDYVEQE